MQFIKTCLRLVATGSSILVLFNCTKEEENISPPTNPQEKTLPDLSEAIQKRVENKPDEAIVLLRKFNEQFPNSPKILIQLSRALADSKQFSLAAFRLEQALRAGASQQLFNECAKIYLLAGDFNSARKYFTKHLENNPEDKQARLSLARVLSQTGMERESLNAFEKVKEKTSAEDALLVGNLYLQKKIYIQAENWFKEAVQKEQTSSYEPLIGLLTVKFASNDENSAESILFAIEKKYPNRLSEHPKSKEWAQFLVNRRMQDFNERGIITHNLDISQLIQALMKEVKINQEPVVSMGPKLSPLVQPSLITDENEQPTMELNDDKKSNSISSLADVFSSPQDERILPTPIEQGWSAYLAKDYSTALLYARQAINQNGKSSEAWRLSSQAHFQLGEIREAEMTILEAIRHNPNDLTTRMDYLNIARDSLSPRRYLNELEKTHERFPTSGEILWQLARRYHLIERMPVTAGILYQKLLRTVPEDSPLYIQAEMELIKIKNL